METSRAIRWLTLKIYGSNLILPDSATWICSVRFAMLFLISSECASWGYAAWEIGGHTLAPYLCIFAVLAAFTLNWTLDGSLMTLDRNTVFSRTLFADAAEPSSLSLRYKALFLVLGRLTMIMVVLSASSGFLVQAIFNKDIQNELRNENKARVEQKRRELLDPFEARISALRSAITKMDQELKEEVQGRSPTRQIGCGDVCKVLQNQLGTLTRELGDKEEQAAEIEQMFEHSSMSELQSRFGIVLLGDGIETRGQILEKIRHNNYTFWTTEWTIRGLLTVLFIGLLLLKLFQPPSVGIYYCSVLQGLYAEYLAGHLNRWLHPDDYPDHPSGGMKPHAFAEWAIKVYGPRKAFDEFKLKKKALEASYEAVMEILERQLSKLGSELQTLARGVTAATDEETKTEAQIGEQHAMAETLAVSVGDLEREHAGLQAGLGTRQIPVKAYARILERLTVVDRELAKRVSEKALLGSTGDKLRVRLSTIRLERSTIADQLASRQKEEASIRQEIATRTEEYFEALNTLRNKYDSLLSAANTVKTENQIPSESTMQPVSATVQ